MMSAIRPFRGALILALAALALGAAAPASSPTMKAVRIHAWGDESVLTYEDAPRPTPGSGEVLVRIKAAGVNPVDWKIRDGMLNGRVELPFIPGFDAAGVVESVGTGESAYKPGDEVFVYLNLMKGGGYAQYALVPVADLAKKPANIDFKTAAGVPLAALTAWQALFDTAELKSGQTVLIHGAAGGVGHFAVQLAKSRGARVIATASEANLAFVKGLGADRVVDYKKEKFEDAVKELGGVDVILDVVGGETQERSIAVINEGGMLVSIVGPPDAAKLAARKARGAGILVKPNGKELAEIAALIEAGKVKPDISATFDLQDAGRAHIEQKTRAGGRGKIVLTVP